MTVAYVDNIRIEHIKRGGRYFIAVTQQQTEGWGPTPSYQRIEIDVNHADVVADTIRNMGNSICSGW